MHDFEIKPLISQNKWTDAVECIKALNRKDNSLSSFCLEDVLHCITSGYSISHAEVSNFLVELFRYLRNSVTSGENQNLVGNNEIVLGEVVIIFRNAANQSGSDLLIKIILQFLVNLVVSNQSTASKVCNILYQDVLDCFYKKKNNHEVLALLYNLHLQARVLCFTEMLINHVLDCLVDGDSEFAQFLAELFLYQEEFWNSYEKLNITRRVALLELLKTRWIERKLNNLPDISLQKISEKFWNSEKVIFQTCSSNNESLEPYEVTLLLEILGCLCGNENYLALLQKDTDLIIRCGVLLINIHTLGKQSENYFSSLQKLSEVREPSEVIQKHPAFGFKVGLVRLIGNLCWKNRRMQNMVREAEIIPVLLDCCNIDARNPLIMQWVILAIRNMCENNAENQTIIAGLHKEGTVSSALVEEMGLTLADDDERGIRIVPLDLKK